MTTAAESPGAEVQQTKKRSWRWLWILVLLGLLGIALVYIKVLIGMVIFAQTGVIEDAELGKAKGDVKTLEINVVRYKTFMNNYPESLEDFVRQPENSTGKWRRLIQKSALNDPWGEPYQYRNPGLKNPDGFDLFSKGQDKTEGTEDDIGNWQ